MNCCRYWFPVEHQCTVSGSHSLSPPFCVHSALVTTTLVSTACTVSGSHHSSHSVCPVLVVTTTVPPVYAHGVMAITTPHVKRQLNFCVYSLLINSWSLWKHIRPVVNSMVQEVQLQTLCRYTQFHSSLHTTDQCKPAPLW